ncbi:ribonuclease H-like domain-containing protein, partial [Tanacetum coccineum]
MTTLPFADTHNLVAFLDKPAESEGFEQIVDFLNASSIRYALTVNPTIYTSCIQQFWATAKVKTVNGEVQLQALVDGKKVIITETSVRRDLQLEDAEGIACLPNADIFEQLALMGYEKPSQKLTFYKAFFSPQWKFLIHTILQCLSAKSTAWNEFSSTMASAIICLATNQKFNFSKYIFESMVKNVDSSVKFLMYPRFVQVFLNQQAGDMSNHKRIYVTPSHTNKIFRNMKREGKGFSGRVTPLFPTMMVQAQEEMGKGSSNPTNPHYTPIITQPSTSKPQKKQKPRKPKRKYTEIPQSSGPTEHIADEATNEENVPTHSNDLLLSGEDSLKLNDLMAICTKLQQRVLDLENTKTAQAQEISSLKLRVKRLDKKGGSRTHKLKRLFKVGRSAQVVSSEDEEVTLVDETQERYGDDLVFDTSVLDGEEVFAGQDVVEKEVSTADPVTTAGEVVTTASVEVSAATTTTTTAITEVDLTLAQALAELRSAKPKVVVQEPVQSTTTTTPSTIPKAKSITFRDPGESTTRTTLTPIPSNIKDKGKAKMIEPEKPLKKKEQIRLDEELAFKLQAEEEEQARLAREKAEKVEEANISWDNVQAMIEADRLLAERLQAREQEELTDEEKARLFVELLEKRKKHFAALRAQEKRNKPPTKAQKKSTMSTYLKHMAGYKQSQLKNKSFAEIQKLFDKAMTRVNMFVDMDTELVKESSKKAEAEMAQESSSKRAGEELEQEVAKKHVALIYKDTENEVVRLMMFPLSLTREAKTWLDELNKGTIETWDELRTAFISCLFPPSLFDRLLGEIQLSFQHENESLTLRAFEMLQNCHGHNLSKGNIIKIFYHGLSEITQEVLNAAAGGIFLYKTPNQAYQLLEDKVLLKLDWAKNQKAKTSLKKTVAFADEGSSNSNTDKIMARMDAMTLKMDAQYKELQNHAKKAKPDEDDIPISLEELAKFMQTF